MTYDWDVLGGVFSDHSSNAFIEVNQIFHVNFDEVETFACIILKLLSNLQIFFNLTWKSYLYM